MNRQIIFVSAYPKSGSTWLTRLLGDVLNSPTGGCMPKEDWREVATEGQDRPGPYIVRKGHFILIDDNGVGEVVPRAHRLAWQRLTNEKIVFLIRDPRDICVSGAYHWNTNPEKFLDRMIRGDIARCGRWDQYCEKWLSKFQTNFGFDVIKYEYLIQYTSRELWRTLFYISSDFTSNKNNRQVLNDAIERQTFASRKAQIGDNEQELRRNNMRKGIAGDWKDHFTDEMNERIWDEFGWMMDRLGYNKLIAIEIL